MTDMRRFLCLAAALLMLFPLCALGEGEEHPVVLISVEGYGDIYAELYPEYAPLTVENFLGLVDSHFYDGLTFHRIISGFMIQGGDPLGNGTGGSSQTIKGEFSANGVDNPLRHERGVLSMARSQNMDSASSQFFIMHDAATHLDGSYAAFGRVLAGQWVVDRICQETPVQDRNGTVLSSDQPVIRKIRRAERAEAEAAREKETQNGQSGGVFSDPCTPLSFPVPQGWNLKEDGPATLLFRYGEDTGKSLFLHRLNYWARLSNAEQQQMQQNGLTRETMDTLVFQPNALQSLTGLQDAQFEKETRSGVLFYTAEGVLNGENTVAYVGAHQGCIYLFAFNGAKTDPLFADITQLLDQMTFREDF